MQQTLEKMITYGRGIGRYRWYAMVMAWVIVLAGWVAVSHIPDEYTADAQIHVDTASILKQFLKGLIVDEDNMRQQLGLMTQLLVRRPNLEQVARMVGFDRQVQTPQQLETMLYRLKKNISVVGSKTNPDPRFSYSYIDLTISYSDGDPELAKQVVQALITTFKDKSVGKTRQDAEITKQFLEQQIKEYKERLTVAENRVQEFKRQHTDVQEKDYFARLQSAQSATKDIELQIREAESQRNKLQQQLKESRLVKLQARLDELLLNYTEAHPEVVATRRSIAELEKQREMELKELSSGTTSSAAVANPEYEYQQLKLKLGEVERELAALRTRQEEYRRRVQVLQQQRETLPVMEAELQRLNRDYEINRERYNTLVERRESMKMSGDIQQTDEEVKFEIVEIPSVSMWKTWRQRIVRITGILAVGLGGGLMLAFVLSKVRPGVYSRHTLGELTGFPVFGMISQVRTSAMRMRERLELASFALASLMMIVAYGTVLFLQFRHVGLNAIVQALGGGG